MRGWNRKRYSSTRCKLGTTTPLHRNCGRSNECIAEEEVVLVNDNGVGGKVQMALYWRFIVGIALETCSRVMFRLRLSWGWLIFSFCLVVACSVDISYVHL